MSDNEIYEEIKTDFFNLNDKIRYSENRFQSALKKATRFPFVQTYPYETRERRNRYIITYTARGPFDYKKPLVSVHCLFREKSGEAAAAINWSFGIVMMYKNHFFRRYRERVIKDASVSIQDTIERFFSKEWSLFGVKITQELEDVFHCFEGHYSDDEVNVLVCTEEGYSFVCKKENLFVMKTIITDEMLSDRQRALFPQLSESHRELNNQIYF